MQLAGFVYSSPPRKSRQQIGNRALALATEHGDAIRSGGHAHERPPSRHHRLLRSHAAERASSCHSPSSSCRPARTTACEYSQDDQTLLPRAIQRNGFQLQPHANRSANGKSNCGGDFVRKYTPLDPVYSTLQHSDPLLARPPRRQAPPERWSVKFE